MTGGSQPQVGVSTRSSFMLRRAYENWANKRRNSTLEGDSLAGEAWVWPFSVIEIMPRCLTQLFLIWRWQGGHTEKDNITFEVVHIASTNVNLAYPATVNDVAGLTEQTWSHCETWIDPLSHVSIPLVECEREGRLDHFRRGGRNRR